MTVYGWKKAQMLVRRELDIQHMLAEHAGLNRVLNTPLLLGPVGGGKTSMAQLEAEERAMVFSPINSGELSDPADFGIPVPQADEDGRLRTMEYCLNSQAAQACKEPVLLFFDDLDKAPAHVQGSFLSIAGSRMFRDQHLHPGTLIMGAGNRVGDDMFANEISESIRTRMTIIEMEPDIKSFVEFGKVDDEIHPDFLGYLLYKPEHLNQPKPNVNRFPCPRGWWEASRHVSVYSDPYEDVFNDGSKDNWRLIVSLKCGDHVGNDFWAWFKIVRRVNVERILKHGVLDTVLDDEGKPADKRMAQYAAIYALSQYLAKHGVKATYTGLESFIDTGLEPELQIALAMQMPPKVLGSCRRRSRAQPRRSCSTSPGRPRDPRREMQGQGGPGAVQGSAQGPHRPRAPGRLLATGREHRDPGGPGPPDAMH